MTTITDTATYLTTAHTEYNQSQFTSGVLSTMSECVSEVESKLKRGTLSTSSTPTLAQVQNWLKRAKLEIAESFGYEHKRKYVYFDLTANTHGYGLPPDYDGGRISLRDSIRDEKVPIWDAAQFDSVFPRPNDVTGEGSLIGCIKNMLLVLIPRSGSTHTGRMLLEYPRSGAETTADDFSWLPELMRYRCCDFAESEAFESIHQLGEADRYRSKYELGLRKAQKADGRRRWQGKKLSAISVFTDYNTRNLNRL